MAYGIPIAEAATGLALAWRAAASQTAQADETGAVTGSVAGAVRGAVAGGPVGAVVGGVGGAAIGNSMTRHPPGDHRSRYNPPYHRRYYDSDR